MRILPQPYLTDRTLRPQALGVARASLEASPREQKLFDLPDKAAGPIVPSFAAYAKREDLLPR